jgi:hypothetical protein
MNIVTYMGILSAFAFFIPVLLIFLLRLTDNKSLVALLCYFFITGVYNLIGVTILKVPVHIEERLFVISNYLDAPLMLIGFLFFCTTAQRRRTIYFSLGIFVTYEIVIAVIYGFSPASVIYIMGPGIVLLLVYSVFFFTHYVKLSIEKNSGFGKTFMITSIVFAYGCYAMIYFFYYLQKSSPIDDVFLIYYIASFVASVLMSIGIIIYKKRLKQFKDIELTRRELRIFFGNP